MTPAAIRSSLQAYSTNWALANVLGLGITEDLLAEPIAEATLLLTEGPGRRAFGGRVLSKELTVAVGLRAADIATAFVLLNDLNAWAINTLDLPGQQGPIAFEGTGTPDTDDQGVAIAAANFTLEIDGTAVPEE